MFKSLSSLKAIVVHRAEELPGELPGGVLNKF